MERPHEGEFSFAFSLWPEHSLGIRRHVGPDAVRQAGRGVTGVVITQHGRALRPLSISFCALERRRMALRVVEDCKDCACIAEAGRRMV